MFIITSNNKTPQSLRKYSCLHLLRCQNNGRLMTAHSGRSVIKPKTDTTVNHQSWERPEQNYVILPIICEQLDMRKGFGFIEIKKK